MSRLLKQSTAFTFRIGPFVDSTDGVTAETALTIAQADIQISKAGGAFAQTSAAPTTTHDADGWYQCPLTATDTGTLGALTVQIVMAGALPVWEHFMVLPANVYDSLVAGSDLLQADMQELDGDNQSAADLKDFADAGYDPSTNKVQGVVLTDTVTTYTGNTVQTGDAYAVVNHVTHGNAALETLVDGVEGTLAAVDGKIDTIDGIVDSILVDTGTTLQAELDGIQADTEDIQSRLPAALTGGGNMKSDALAISGDTTAADRLEAMMDGIIVGQVNDAGATTTSFVADGFTEATNDHLNGRLITFVSGALSGQQTDITDYVGATQTFTVTALTEAPANDDFFIIH